MYCQCRNHENNRSHETLKRLLPGNLILHPTPCLQEKLFAANPIYTFDRRAGGSRLNPSGLSRFQAFPLGCFDGDTSKGIFKKLPKIPEYRY